MAFIFYNPNPGGHFVSDCVVRALCATEGMTWLEAYYALCNTGAAIFDMPRANKVYREYLTSIGYKRYVLPNTCPECYTVKDFCRDHPYGTYILCTGDHVVAVKHGDYYDAGDSGSEVPLYFYKKEK